MKGRDRKMNKLVDNIRYVLIYVAHSNSAIIVEADKNIEDIRKIIHNHKLEPEDYALVEGKLIKDFQWMNKSRK